MHETSSIHRFRVTPPVRRWRVLVAALSLGLWCGFAAAAPGDVSKFPINDDNPSASIPPLEARNANPLQFGYFLQDLYTKGELAFEKKDWAVSAKYFEAIAKVITDRARSFSKLCEAYQHLDEVESARANCAKAIVLPGATLMDHRRFLDVSLSAKALTRSDVANIDASIAHVRAQVAELPDITPPPRAEIKPLASGAPPGEAARVLAEMKEAQRERNEAKQSSAERADFMQKYEGLVCRLGLRLRDAARLGRCVDELKRQKADARVVLTFEWSKALITRDRARSRELLEQARKLQIPAATLAAMSREHDDTFGLLALLKRWKLVAGALVACVVIAGGALAWLRRRRRSAPPPRASLPASEQTAS